MGSSSVEDVETVFLERFIAKAGVGRGDPLGDPRGVTDTELGLRGVARLWETEPDTRGRRVIDKPRYDAKSLAPS